MKSYDGTLEFHKRDNFMILNNAKGKQIGYRFLKSHETLCLGSKLSFPMHIVRVGSQNNKLLYKAKTPTPEILDSSKVSQPECSVIELPSQKVDSSASLVHTDHRVENQEDILSVYESIKLGLDFSHGISF
jgi:hypothetical protein